MIFLVEIHRSTCWDLVHCEHHKSALANIRKHASKKKGYVDDESWKTETTFEIEGTQLYASNTALGTDGGVYDRSFYDISPRITTFVKGVTYGLFDWNIPCGLLVAGW